MYTFSDLVDIIARLRGKGGCPWDAEQTHESLRRCLIEEAYESLEAIDSGRGEKMADELGDLMLQIVMHAQIGKEEGSFTIDDVTTAICEKMIRRHPHVFGSVTVQNSAEVLQNWEEIKKEENGTQSTAETMRRVCAYLPSLLRADKVFHKAQKVAPASKGAVMQDLADAADALCKCGEHDRTEKVGKLLFAAACVANLLGVNPEDALSRATDAFIAGFEEKA